MLGLESSSAMWCCWNSAIMDISQYQEHIQSRNNLRFLIATWIEMSTGYLQVTDWDDPVARWNSRAKLSIILILRLVKLFLSTIPWFKTLVWNKLDVLITVTIYLTQFYISTYETYHHLSPHTERCREDCQLLSMIMVITCYTWWRQLYWSRVLKKYKKVKILR